MPSHCARRSVFQRRSNKTEKFDPHLASRSLQKRSGTHRFVIKHNGLIRVPKEQSRELRPLERECSVRHLRTADVAHVPDGGRQAWRLVAAPRKTPQGASARKQRGVRCCVGLRRQENVSRYRGALLRILMCLRLRSGQLG